MRYITKLLAVLCLLLATAPALAQSTPGLTFGQVPSPAQWNSYFAAKQDFLNFVPLNRAGGTMSGPLVTAASTAGAAGLNVPPGVAPTSPNNGDLWTTSSGVYAQINGSTLGPFSAAGTGTVTSITCSGSLTGGVITGAGTCDLSATPNLGTPSAAVLTNATGLPVGALTGLGTGVGTWLATPTSANLATSLTDETGSGSAVFSINPALTAPVLTGVPTGSGVDSAATASTLVARDANANFAANNVTRGYATTATAAGTTTLTVASAQQQFFTGTTTQTVLLPVTSTLILGQSYTIVNNSSGAVAVDSSGSNLILSVAAGNTGVFTVVSTSGTTAASWSSTYISSGAGTGTVTSITCGTGLTGGTVTTTGTCALSSPVAVANGGTALASGTSGGVLGFTGTGTIASSAALTANAIVLGGGAGATPTALGSLGTTTTLLHGNAAGAPSYGAVGLTTDVTGVLPTANGGTGAANLNGLLQAGTTNTISVGYTYTPNNLGTISSGTTTLNGALGNYQYLTNNGAFTMAAPTSDTAINVLVTNGASAGAITMSGFTVGSNTGDSYTTTNTSKFMFSIVRINSVSTYTIKALQ